MYCFTSNLINNKKITAPEAYTPHNSLD